MAKAEITYSGAAALVVRVNNKNHVKNITNIIMDMVKEFGITKTHQTIQALYDAGRIDQNTAGFLLDDLKQECSRKQATGMVLL